MGSVQTKTQIDRDIVRLTEKLSALRQQRIMEQQIGNNMMVQQLDRQIVDIRGQLQVLRAKRRTAPN